MNNTFKVRCSDQEQCKEYNCECYGPKEVTTYSIDGPEWCVIMQRLVFPEPLDIIEFNRICEKEGMVP